ncbi:hypothetical protein DPMN_022337 [Dreissena polymorpha]|uniref:Uncharacterized protein n=1 Tax=Dreissena polymorpha TaxID=45954 RepID=A0A9D4NQ72_DREPO|nr:hypothetical protein DPMN_022337 [Dreissena polymorpha]
MAFQLKRPDNLSPFGSEKGKRFVRAFHHTAFNRITASLNVIELTKNVGAIVRVGKIMKERLSALSKHRRSDCPPCQIKPIVRIPSFTFHLSSDNHLVDGPTDRQTDRPTDRQTDRPT